MEKLVFDLNWKFEPDRRRWQFLMDFPSKGVLKIGFRVKNRPYFCKVGQNFPDLYHRLHLCWQEAG